MNSFVVRVAEYSKQLIIKIISCNGVMRRCGQKIGEKQNAELRNRNNWSSMFYHQLFFAPFHCVANWNEFSYLDWAKKRKFLYGGLVSWYAKVKKGTRIATRYKRALIVAREKGHRQRNLCFFSYLDRISVQGERVTVLMVYFSSVCLSFINAKI